MDPAILIGLVVAMVAIFGSMILEGGSPGSLFLIPAMFLIFVGTPAVSLAGNTMAGLTSAIKWMVYAMTAKKADLEGVVQPLVKMAERARREGLLALEQEMETVEDEFMRKGLQMAVDGTDPDDLYEILSAEVKAKKQSAATGAKFWADAGGYAPTLGIIGTVMGLVNVLSNLAEPAELGHLIAGAFVATLWGVMSANVLFLPIGKRITTVGANEAARMELIIEGVLAIQAGSNPRVVATKLKSKMPPAGPAPDKAKEAA
jgi:chemotaxis protein MotA